MSNKYKPLPRFGVSVRVRLVRLASVLMNHLFDSRARGHLEPADLNRLQQFCTAVDTFFRLPRPPKHLKEVRARWADLTAWQRAEVEEAGRAAAN